MAEIKVKVTEIDTAITKLQALKTRCTSADTKSPNTVGGGQSVNELEAIAGVYKNLNTHFATLVQNTISFLGNVKDSYAASDQKAATQITGGGGSSSGTGSSRSF